jgi:imidazolonepropionase-like amidohydrolase
MVEGTKIASRTQLMAVIALAAVSLLLALAEPPAADSAFPGNNGKIAFSRLGDIFVMDADGSNKTNLTNNPAADSLPNWSADGTKIVFHSSRDGNNQIYSMNSDGTGQTRLTNNSAQEAGATWSPDGLKIAFRSNRDGNNEIYTMNADGSNQTRLTTDAASDEAPTWSPDGTKIAFESTRAGAPDIFVMNADGSAQTNVTSLAGFDQAPDWSPDGAKIAFSSNRSGNYEIYIVNEDGSGAVNVTNNPAFDHGPSWSPDGAKIAFYSNRAGPVTQVYAMNADGSSPLDLSNDTDYNDAGARWQPVPAPLPPSVVVWNGTVIDGTGASIANGSVVIVDGIITYVGPYSGAPLPPNAQFVDAGGGSILPGVIDAHAHTLGDLVYGLDRLTPWLQTGVTTLQDQGTAKNGALLHRSALGTIPAQPPRVQLAGPIITAPNGYPYDRYHGIIDHEVATVQEARDLVIDLIENQGVDTIKIAVERGFTLDYYDTGGYGVLTPEQIAAITEEAHEPRPGHPNGVIVGAHVTGPDELKVAYDNGVDVAVHMPLQPLSLRPDVVAEAVAQDMVLVSTAGPWMNPQSVVANIGTYHAAGGRIALGSDYPFAPNGMPLYEFQAMQVAGLSNPEIVVAATRNAAAAIGRSDDLGTLEVGKIGDVITLAGNPHVSWTAFASVVNVVLAGEIVRQGTPPGDDGDGINWDIDVQDGVFSNDFSDVSWGGTTFGGIVTRAGLTVAVSDATGDDGVRIATAGVGGPAIVAPCGDPIAQLHLDPGDEVIVTCGSAVVEVIEGPVTAQFDSLMATIPEGALLSVENPEEGGPAEATNDASSTGDVVVGGIVIPPGTTSPIEDTDDDGLADSVETDTGVYVSTSDTGTDPAIADGDADGLLDGHEVFLHSTNPFIPDSDADLSSDSAEVAIGTDPLDVDTDDDGCADGEEARPTHVSGGQRDPLYFWDFYDVNANKVIDLQDAIVVLQHFGHGYNGGAYVDGTDNLLDRTAPIPAMPWLAQEANNGLDLGDALAVLKSFGDNCVAAP